MVAVPIFTNFQPLAEFIKSVFINISSDKLGKIILIRCLELSTLEVGNSRFLCLSLRIKHDLRFRANKSTLLLLDLSFSESDNYFKS